MNNDVLLIVVALLCAINVAGVVQTIVMGSDNWPLFYRLWLASVGVVNLWIGLSAFLTLQSVYSALFHYTNPQVQEIALLASISMLPCWMSGWWLHRAIRRFRIDGQRYDLRPVLDDITKHKSTPK